MDNSKVFFALKKEKKRLEHFIKFKKDNNDSVLIWHHPILDDKYAKEEESKLDVSDNLASIIFSGILLLISISAIAWQTMQWIRNIKNKNKL